MFCISLGKTTFEKCKEVMQSAEMVELRLDLLRLQPEAIEKLCKIDVPIIATCRAEGYTDEERKELLKIAIAAGASHVDIEIEAPQTYQKELVQFAKQHSCKVIISYHNYEATPSLNELKEIVATCFEYGGDIAKIATVANSSADSARLLSLYDSNEQLVILGMGLHGKITRIAAPYLGGLFTFVALDETQLTAPGQLDWKSMNQIRKIINT